MEMLEEGELRSWLLAVVLRTMHSRDRSTDQVDEHGNEVTLPAAHALVGPALLDSVVFHYERLAKGLLGFSGRANSSLSAEESELLLATKARIERLVHKMNNEEPGLWVIDPKYTDDPEAEQKRWWMPGSAKATMKLVARAERELEGTKWMRFVSERAAKADQVLGRD